MPSGLIKDRDFCSVTKNGGAVSQKYIDILNESAFADLIVCNVILILPENLAYLTCLGSKPSATSTRSQSAAEHI